MMKKKMLAAGLIVTTLGMTLTGCSGTKKEEAGTTGTTETTVAPGEVKKPEKIKVMYSQAFLPEDGADEWAKEYTAKTGIELELQYVNVNEYAQKLELAFAAGEAPDVFTIADGKLPIYAAQGALVDMTSMIGSSEIMQGIDTKVWDSIEISDKLYGAPLERGNGPVTYMRKDWLDKLGMEVPTNYEEYTQALRGFKTLGPDVIPFTAAGLVDRQAEMYLADFYQDASPEFVNVDGKWVDGMTQPNMEDALTRMKDAYAEGLMDLEVVTNKTSTCRDKWYAGNVGAFTYWAGNWNVSLEDRLKSTDPEAEVIALPAIEETQYLERVPVVLGISSANKNPEGVFKYFIEYMQDGGEGSVLFQHGVENIHYAKEGDNIVHLPKLSKPDELIEKAFVTPALSLVETTIEGYNYELDERMINSIAILAEDGKQLTCIPVSKTLGKINSDLLALREKTVSSVVLGNTTYADAMAKYNAEAENLGMAQIIEELNAK